MVRLCGTSSGMFSDAANETTAKIENIHQNRTHPLMVVAIRSIAGRGMPTPIDRKKRYICGRHHTKERLNFDFLIFVQVVREGFGGWERGWMRPRRYLSDPSPSQVIEGCGTVDVKSVLPPRRRLELVRMTKRQCRLAHWPLALLGVAPRHWCCTPTLVLHPGLGVAPKPWGWQRIIPDNQSAAEQNVHRSTDVPGMRET